MINYIAHAKTREDYYNKSNKQPSEDNMHTCIHKHIISCITILLKLKAGPTVCSWDFYRLFHQICFCHKMYIRVPEC